MDFLREFLVDPAHSECGFKLTTAVDQSKKSAYALAKAKGYSEEVLDCFSSKKFL